jgi:predicted NBD/HSP70 family sugar kinase
MNPERAADLKQKGARVRPGALKASPPENGHASATGPHEQRSLRRADLAYVQLATSETARDINRDVVLELVRAQQPVTRVDLARASGLQKSTISAIVEQLIEEGWIVEGGTVRQPRGRRPTLLSLNDNIVILAVDLLPTRAIVAIVDLNSRLLDQEMVMLPSDPQKAVPMLIECLKRLRAHHGRRVFEGIGISMPGRVDPQTQRLVLAPHLRWAGYDISGEIERALGLKVEMENEANACLISEVWSGRLDGVRNAVLVAISEGIGTAILANGQMLTGRGGLAGEFGHVVLDPAGELCGCGRKGCWETFASTSAALRYCESEGRTGEEGMTTQKLLSEASNGEARAIAALTKQAEYLGAGLHAITAALSPEVILFTGDIVSEWKLIEPIIEATLRSKMLAGEAPRLLTTSNPEFARLRGAAALVLQRHSGYHRMASAR